MRNEIFCLCLRESEREQQDQAFEGGKNLSLRVLQISRLSEKSFLSDTLLTEETAKENFHRMI